LILPRGIIMTEMRRVEIVVRGRVQGVFYRDSTRRKAMELGLVGTVRNLPDGAVEIVAEGPAAALETLVQWCRLGPPAAEVRDASTVYCDPSGRYSDFSIRY
jgi:acylphosphatase